MGALCLLAAVSSDAALLQVGKSMRQHTLPRPVILMFEEAKDGKSEGAAASPVTAPVATDPANLSELDFDERLALLAAQIPDVRPDEDTADVEEDRSDER